MLFLLRCKSNIGLELVKRTLIHRHVATTTSIKSNEKRVKSFTQRDFDRVHRKEVDKFKKKIEQRSSEDPFSPIKYFFKALGVGFILATICSISYGETFHYLI